MDIPNQNEKEDIQLNNNLELNIFDNFESTEKNQKELKNFENINSPKLIQDILHLSSQSLQNGFELHNNLIRSLYSFNDTITTIMDDDFSEDNINFNPSIIFLKKRNKLNMMNFPQINSDNNFLLNKINQYNDLKQKISEFKSLENKKNEKENNNEEEVKEENKEEFNLKLFLSNHPLINLFKDEIDIKKLKEEIQARYLKKMKDNTDYKPGPENPHLINILEQEVSENEEENDEENENISEPSGIALEGLEEEVDSQHEDLVINMDIEHIEPQELIDLNENNNQDQPINENNINNPPEIIQIPHAELIQPIEPNVPLEPIEPIPPIEPIVPIEPIQPEEPIAPIEPIPPIEPMAPNEPNQPIEPIEHIELIHEIEPLQFFQPLGIIQPFQPIPPVSPEIQQNQPIINNEQNQEQTQSLTQNNNNINNEQIEQNNNIEENNLNIDVIENNENENNEADDQVVEENKENNE